MILKKLINYNELITDVDNDIYKIDYILLDSNYIIYFCKCKLCKYETSIKQAFMRHLKAKKHKNNVINN